MSEEGVIPDYGARTEAALHNHSAFGIWVSAADTKSSFAAAVAAVLVAGLASRSGDIAALAACDASVATAARLTALLTLAAIGVTAAFLGSVQWPRLTCPAANPYAWPSAAKHDIQTLLLQLDDPARRADAAWEQARTLAAIAGRKHRAYRRALAALFLSGAAFAIWGVLMVLAAGHCP